MKRVWMKEAGLLAGEVDKESQVFWNAFDPHTRKKLTQSFSCMDDFGILGTYFSGFGDPVESFGLKTLDRGPGYYGLIHGTPKVCFNKNFGLLVYRWIHTNAWDATRPQFMIRGRFIGKTSFKVAKAGTLKK